MLVHYLTGHCVWQVRWAALQAFSASSGTRWAVIALYTLAFVSNSSLLAFLRVSAFCGCMHSPLPLPLLPSQETCCGVQSLTDWYAVDFPGKNESFPNSVPVSCCDLSKWSLSSPCTGVDVTTAEVKQQKYFSQVEMGGNGRGGKGRGGEGRSVWLYVIQCVVLCIYWCLLTRLQILLLS